MALPEASLRQERRVTCEIAQQMAQQSGVQSTNLLSHLSVFAEIAFPYSLSGRIGPFRTGSGKESADPLFFSS
jgi:hypothetical protein